MRESAKKFVVPILVISVGVGWLLNVKEVFTGVDWIWTCCLFAGGIIVMLAGGLDKVTGVVGPFLIVAAVLSILRQTGHLEVETEIPILVISIGALLFITRMMKLKTPEYLKEEKEESTEES